MNRLSSSSGWRELWELHERIQQLFRQVTGPRPATARWHPPVDIFDDDQAWWVEFDLPGVAPEQINLQVKAGNLWLAGEKPPSREPNSRVLRSERRYGRFGALVPLPRETDYTDLTAELDKGVLRVRIGRRKESQARRIPVQRTGDQAPAPQGNVD